MNLSLLLQEQPQSEKRLLVTVGPNGAGGGDCGYGGFVDGGATAVAAGCGAAAAENGSFEDDDSAAAVDGDGCKNTIRN